MQQLETEEDSDNMKIVRLDIDENSVLAGIDAVALVEQPAIEEDFIYFSKHKEDEFQETYTDYPQGAVDAAKMGIKRNAALDNKCGTQVGKVRAQQLAQRKPISLDTVRRMRAFLIRQKGNYELAIERKNYNACGYISYLLWGGPEALPWAEKILRQAEGEEAFAEVGPRGGIRKSPKAPKSKTKNPNPKGKGTARGSAGTTRGAKVSKEVEKTLKKKSDDFNERYKEKLGYGANVGALKSVYQRGLGAYNTSRSPAVASRGGAKQWAMARVNAFLYLLKNGRPQNKKYTTDYDLLPAKHPKKEKMNAITEALILESMLAFKADEVISGIQTYTTKEEAIAAAEKAGIKGYHTHQNSKGETVYMPGEKHSDATDALLEDAFAAMDDEQVLVGPLMTPNKLIKRRDADGEYYVYFTEETIKKLAYKSMKDKIIDRVNLEHDSMEPVDAYMVETWLVEDPENDKALKYGYTPKMGQWFAAYKVDDREIWENYVKTGMVKGFSVEGMFQQMLFSKTQCRKNGSCACGQTNHPGGLCDGSHLKIKK